MNQEHGYSKTSLETSFGVSANILKMFAIVTMLIDHIGAVVLEGDLMWRLGDSFSGKMVYVCDMILRTIGRLAFPIFCFFLVEGFFQTRKRWKYTLRLLIFALVSEIPFDLAILKVPFGLEYQNVGFELLAGMLMMWACQVTERKIGWNRGKARRIVILLLQTLLCAVTMLLANGCNLDYHWGGILLIFLFYRFRGLHESHSTDRVPIKDRILQVVIAGIGFSLYEFSGIGGVLLNLLYNGERGNQSKYFFYVFYPVHLLLLYGIGQLLGGILS